MAISNSTASAVANYIFGNVSTQAVSPTTWYVGLCTGTVSTGGVITGEPTGNGYARVAITNDSANFVLYSDNTVRNINNITFPEATGSWGNIAYAFLSTTSTGGTANYYYQFSPTKPVQAQYTVIFNGSATGANSDFRFSITN